MNEDEYKVLAKQMEDGEFSSYDASGGNFDDAFELGYSFALAEVKYETDLVEEK
jgi:hypothetical protein